MSSAGWWNPSTNFMLFSRQRAAAKAGWKDDSTAPNRTRETSGAPAEPDFHSAIETDDGAVILWDMRGYAFPEAEGALPEIGDGLTRLGRISASVKHTTVDERYEWLTRALCVVTGEVRIDEEGVRTPVLDVAQLVWEPFAD